MSAVHFHLGERGFLDKNDAKNFLSYKPKGELSEQQPKSPKMIWRVAVVVDY